MALVAYAPDTMIVVDNARNIEALSQAAQSSDVVLAVLVDIDLGFGRTGVLTHDAVEELARQISAGPTYQVCRSPGIWRSPSAHT